MDIIVLTAHADDSEKIEILKRNLISLKSVGFPIILSSHIKVPTEIINDVDYFVYDMENPIIDYDEFDDPILTGASVWHFVNYPQYSQKFNLSFNHAFAHLKLMKNAVDLASVNGYKKIHIVNYDYLVKDVNVIKDNSKILDHYDARTYYFPSYEDRVITPFYSIKIDHFKRCFDLVNSKYHYAAYRIAIFESFTNYVFEANGLKIFRSDINDIKEKIEIDLNKLDIISEYTILDNQVDKGNVFLTQFNSVKYLFFLVKENLEFVVEISNKSYSVKPTVNSPYLLRLEEEDILCGVLVSQEKYNWKIKFNNTSKMAKGIINNYSIVHTLN